MRAKDYLMQILNLERRIKNKFLEVERWKEAASFSGNAEESERVQSSGRKDKMASAVCKYVDMEAELLEEIKALAKARQDIIKTIEQLECTDEYDVLHKRYVQGMDIQNIADQMDKSYSWVTTTHGKALLNVQRILESENLKNERVN